MPSPLAELFRDLRSAFDSLGTGWYLFGAQAAILHGVGRLSADVDVTVLAGSTAARELLEVLAGHGFEARVASAEQLARDLRVLPLRHVSSQVPVDLVLGAPGLEEQFLARAIERNLDGVMVPVASPEDLVVMKVLAGRNKDLDDVAALCATSGLDRREVSASLRELERALDRGDLLSTFERIAARSERD